MSDFDFRFFQFDIGRAKAFDLANLLRVIHGVEHEPARMWTQKHGVLAVVHGQLGDGDVLALFQGLGQQAVWPAPRFLWQHVVRRFKKHRIDFAGFYELHDLHGLRSLRFDLLDLFGLNHYVFVLAEFVALYDFTALHHPIVGRTVILLLDPLQVIAMQHVEGDAAAACAGDKTHRHGDQAESKISRPNRSCHKFTPNRKWPKRSAV